jgi:hypothetical protein
MGLRLLKFSPSGLQIVDGDQHFNLRQDVVLAVSIELTNTLRNSTLIRLRTGFITVELKSKLKFHKKLLFVV